MSGGFWKLDHEDLVAVLARRDLAWESVRVYLAIADLTIGYGHESDVVSVGQIAGLASIKRWHVDRALKDLASRGLYGQETLEPRKVRRWVVWPASAITVAGDITKEGDRGITVHGDEVSPTSVHTKKKKGRRERAHTHFVPPTTEQVSQYAASIGYALDAQRFVDHYTAKGWKMGKTPIQDWKAAVRTWQSRDHGATGSHKPSSSLGASPNDPTWDPSPEEAEALLGGGKP